jgi:hypothetical protein
VHSAYEVQRRLEVAEGARASKAAVPQTIRAAQILSDDAVAGIVWYCDAVQIESAVHTRLVVAVGAADWYWIALHTVSAEHTRLVTKMPVILAGAVPLNWPSTHGLRSEQG